MGVVWVAHDPLLDICVALKLLPPAGLTGPGAQRLLLEARAAARLRHPAIVQVLDFGVADGGEPYLVLELLHGETLGAAAAGGAMSPEQIVSLVLPILDALATAHDHGVVHRDIKPENLFVAREANGRVQPKVLDFGIAKSSALGEGRITSAGVLVGTPAYMAPEQARGDDDLDGRTDVWGLSATLYELLGGAPPFADDDVPELLRAILEREPPSLERVAGVDACLASIVSRGLAKDRDARFEDARAMGLALACWLADRGVAEDACGTSIRSAWSAPEAVSVRAVRRADLPGAAPTQAELTAVTTVVASRARGSTAARGRARHVIALGAALVLFAALYDAGGAPPAANVAAAALPVVESDEAATLSSRPNAAASVTETDAAATASPGAIASLPPKQRSLPIRSASPRTPSNRRPWF